MGWLRQGGPRGRASVLRGLVPLAPVLGLCIWVTVAPPYTNSPPIRSDGLGYYAWTAAILHGNFDFCEWATELNVVSAISGQNPGHPNRCENKYPPGLALLRFPVMGPVAAISNHAGAGQLTVTPAEEKASQWLGVLALLVTLGFTWLTIRRLGVAALLADAATLAACFGTGLFHYATYDSSFAHIYSAALFAAVLYVGVRAVQLARPPNIVVVFGLALFIMLIREPDALALGVLVIGWLAWWARTVDGPARRAGIVRVVVACVGALIVVELFQIGYNRWSAGVWAVSSYGSESLSLGQGKELSVLFGYDHGLLSWYPILLVMLGLSLGRRAARGWGWLSLGVVAVFTVLYGSWTPWFLGGAMGMRGFVDVVPVFAVAGAVGASTLRFRVQLALLPAAIVLTLVTVNLMAAYWSGYMPFASPTPHQFWGSIAGDGALIG